jgi:FtsP/CotA-like multicopper oxidase with cupredoxin domain
MTSTYRSIALRFGAVLHRGAIGVGAVLLAAACSGDSNQGLDFGLVAAVSRAGAARPSALDVDQPAGWDDDLALTKAVDRNPDPNIVEIDLEAKLTELEILPGHKTKAWTYGGTLPGPLISANVGDTVIVHFKNSLPEATSIHWHGLRVTNDMDGVPGVTQDPVDAGAEFRYEFVVRDAGTFWYHPHINSAAQVGWGMYGPIIVRDPNDPRELGDDLVLVMSDMSLDDDGSFQPADSGGKFGDLFGREGSAILVNGKVMPRLKVRAGKQQRWRVINAARARYYSLRIRDHVLTRIGGDNGLAARPEQLYRVLVTPGERADIVFTPSDEPGTVRTVLWAPTDRGYGSLFSRPRVPMMEIETVDAPPVEPAVIPEKLRKIEPIDVSSAIEKTLEMTIDLSNNDVVMGFNNTPYWEMTPIEARIGETHIWTLRNYTDFNHPFHLHGYYFQVLDDTRVPEWKDTVDVPVDTELRIAVRFDERPGMWMYHCHILDHAEVGMMGQLHVAE